MEVRGIFFRDTRRGCLDGRNTPASLGQLTERPLLCQPSSDRWQEQRGFNRSVLVPGGGWWRLSGPCHLQIQDDAWRTYCQVSVPNCEMHWTGAAAGRPSKAGHRASPSHSRSCVVPRARAHTASSSAEHDRLHSVVRLLYSLEDRDRPTPYTPTAHLITVILLLPKPVLQLLRMAAELKFTSHGLNQTRPLSLTQLWSQ